MFYDKAKNCDHVSGESYLLHHYMSNFVHLLTLEILIIEFLNDKNEQIIIKNEWLDTILRNLHTFVILRIISQVSIGTKVLVIGTFSFSRPKYIFWFFTYNLVRAFSGYLV